MTADRGLLEYDGNSWNHFIGSNGFTRSVLVVNDSLIYTGSDLDFGVWKRNKFRDFNYTSLYPFQEDLQDINEEFWQIHPFQDDILFVSSQSIYIYRNRQLVKIAAPTSFTGSFWVNERLYFADRGNGLFTFDGFSLRKVLDLPDVENPDIIGVYQIKDDLVIVTRDEGLFIYTNGNILPFNSYLSEELRKAKVFSFEKVGDHHIAIGTVLKGLFIIDLNGRIIHHINRQKGLPSNTILSLHYSWSGKLWLGMDYGVSSLDLTSNVTTFYDYRGDFGTGYTAKLMEDIFYLGTNQGLYSSEWEKLNNNLEFFQFELIPKTEGQVWTLEIINQKLLMGHDKGLFEIYGNNAEQISDQEGVWTIIPYHDFLLTGNYNGISIFRNVANRWVFDKKMELIFGSCNQLIHEKDNILWINIPNFGIIRAVLDSQLKPAERLIFPLDLFKGQDVFILHHENDIHILSEQYQYTFDASKMDFVKKPEHIVFPTIQDQLAGVFKPVDLHPEYDFLPIYNGFALIYKNQKEATRPNHQLVLRQMTAFNNHEQIMLHPGARIPYQLNNLNLKIIVPNREDVLYQYKFKDSDKWSEWQAHNIIEFLGLRNGHYKITIRALVNGQYTEEKVIFFRISAPLYFKWYAFVFYFLLLALIIYFILTWQKVSLKKQKKKMLLKEQSSLRQQTEKHKQQLMLVEQKRLQAEYDQVKQQLKSKTIELANKAKDNEEKNRLLLNLKEKCEKAQQNPALFEMKWREMQRILDSYLTIQDNTFEIQMDELHQEFFKKLKEKFPDLSNNDLRLCAYLKIGLNSKEIAELLNIQPSSFYISRSRLRKKLNLKPEEDLYTFLNQV